MSINIDGINYDYTYIEEMMIHQMMVEEEAKVCENFFKEYNPELEEVIDNDYASSKIEEDDLKRMYYDSLYNKEEDKSSVQKPKVTEDIDDVDIPFNT